MHWWFEVPQNCNLRSFTILLHVQTPINKEGTPCKKSCSSLLLVEALESSTANSHSTPTTKVVTNRIWRTASKDSCKIILSQALDDDSSIVRVFHSHLRLEEDEDLIPGLQ